MSASVTEPAKGTSATGDVPPPVPSRTTSTGTTITIHTGPRGRTVVLDHPDAPADMRHTEAGRVIDRGFQPAPFAPFAMSPEVLRHIASLIEEAPDA